LLAASLAHSVYRRRVAAVAEALTTARRSQRADAHAAARRAAERAPERLQPRSQAQAHAPFSSGEFRQFAQQEPHQTQPPQQPVVQPQPQPPQQPRPPSPPRLPPSRFSAPERRAAAAPAGGVVAVEFTEHGHLGISLGNGRITWVEPGSLAAVRRATELTPSGMVGSDEL
jgi:hypothetical protein